MATPVNTAPIIKTEWNPYLGFTYLVNNMLNIDEVPYPNATMEYTNGP